MPKVKYVDIDIGSARRSVIDKANEIIAEYSAQGFDLTLRQLYYQFVSRGLLPNKQLEYKKLGDVINDGRLAGLIDWYSIVDRTRNLRGLNHWTSPSEIVAACAQQYRRDKWETQSFYVEVWIEKDALVGVIESICGELDVPFFSCRGYTSQSEMWSAAQRLIRKTEERSLDGSIIVHLGDHDPSGIDMSRDIQDRLRLFRTNTEVRRIALTMEQVRQYNPPPNPAKLTDSRCEKYVAQYGNESWELDALEPRVLADLIHAEVSTFVDDRKRRLTQKQEDTEKRQLKKVSARWAEIANEL